jgi:predicted phosphodiesterase
VAKRARRIFIFPDRHIGLDIGNPVVDALSECVLRAVEYWTPDLVVGLGDLIEAAAWSSHPPSSADKAKASGFVEDELEPSREFLDRIQAASGRLHLLLGNHCARVERKCLEYGMSTSDMRLLMPSHFLARTKNDKLRKNFSLTPYTDAKPFYQVTPNLVATHGMSYSTTAAKQHLDIFRNMNVVFGHVHSAMYYSTRNPITEESLEAWTDGCICSRTPGYKAHQAARWSWGCTAIYQSQDRLSDWTRVPVKFIEIDNTVRCIMPDGKSITVKIKR